VQAWTQGNVTQSIHTKSSGCVLHAQTNPCVQPASSFAATMPPRKKKPKPCGTVCRQAANGTASELLDLPLDLLVQILAALTAADHRGLAGSCHKLRDLVVSQASKLTVWLEDDIAPSCTTGLRASLLAAIRRPHGRRCLTLDLYKAPGRRIRGFLKQLGTCPAVEELNLKYVMVSGHRSRTLLCSVSHCLCASCWLLPE
jgi:hypothetical protein